MKSVPCLEGDTKYVVALKIIYRMICDGRTVRHHHHHHVVLVAQISLTLSRQLFPIVHRLWQVFRATFRILT